MGASRMSFGALRRTASGRMPFWTGLPTPTRICSGDSSVNTGCGSRTSTETPEIMEAVKRLSPQEKEERSMRLRRAVDLSFKRTYLPADRQASHEPFKMYLHPNIVQVERRWRKRRPSSASTGQC